MCGLCLKNIIPLTKSHHTSKPNTPPKDIMPPWTAVLKGWMALRATLEKRKQFPLADAHFNYFLYKLYYIY